MDAVARIQDIERRFSDLEAGIFALLRENRQVETWDAGEHAALKLLVAKIGAWQDLVAQILYRGPADVVRDLEEISDGNARGMN